MKKTYIFGVVAALIVAAVVVYFQVVKPQLDNRTVAVVVPATITAGDFEFTYPSGEAGYSLIEPPVATSTGSALMKVYLLMRTDEYIKYQNKEYGDEAPPMISVFIFDNQSDDSEEGKVTRLQNWARANSALTSYEQLATEAEVADLDGEVALHYGADGMHLQDIYVASHKGNVYLLVGQYDEGDNDRQTVFTDLVHSILFN